MSEGAGAYALTARDGLPEALTLLRASFPRDAWRDHKNFGEMVQFWMDRHAMFRRLLGTLNADAQARAGGTLSPEAHAPRLSRFGGLFLQELHMHHMVEDQHYFPQLVGLAPELDRGFALLESDHGAIDPMLEDMAQHMNGVLSGGAEAGALVERLERFERLLNRHLTDEEDLVVPVILKSGFTG